MAEFASEAQVPPDSEGSYKKSYLTEQNASLNVGLEMPRD